MVNVSTYNQCITIYVSYGIGEDYAYGKTIERRQEAFILEDADVASDPCEFSRASGLLSWRRRHIDLRCPLQPSAAELDHEVGRVLADTKPRPFAAQKHQPLCTQGHRISKYSSSFHCNHVCIKIDTYIYIHICTERYIHISILYQLQSGLWYACLRCLQLVDSMAQLETFPAEGTEFLHTNFLVL